MGLRGLSTKSAMVAPDARAAFGEGRLVFMCRATIKNTGFAAMGQLMGFGEMVERVEAEGWRLEQMSFDQGQGFFMFRRDESMRIADGNGQA